MTAPEQPQGVLLRYAGGEVYAPPTRGTEHTARLARAAGLTVDAQTWQPEQSTRENA